MILLDCESVDSTYRSLERIMGVGEAELTKSFADIDLDRIYIHNPDESRSGPELLFEILSDGREIQTDFFTCWFHLTRSVRNHTFDKGILPLGRQIDAIWVDLYELTDNFPLEDWARFRNRVENKDFKMSYNYNRYSQLYRLKTTTDYLWGPYAMLVKEVAYNPTQGRIQNYLKIPETVEDICICFSELYGEDLVSAYQKKTEPCMIKFGQEKACHHCLFSSLYYLYCNFHHEELNDSSTSNFDSKGKTISANAIIKIDFLDNVL